MYFVATFFSHEKAQKMTYIPYTQRTGGVQRSPLYFEPFLKTHPAMPVPPKRGESKGGLLNFVPFCGCKQIYELIHDVKHQ